MVKPASGGASHCIGVRSGSRPRPMPGCVLPAGSCTHSGGIGDVAPCRSRRRSRRRRAAQGEQQHRRDPGLRWPDARGDRATGRGCPAPSSARRPAAARPRSRRRCARSARVPGRRDQLEIERQMRLVAVRAVIGDQPVDRQVDLADQHAVADSRPARAHFARRCRAFRPVGGVERQQPINTACMPGCQPGSAGCRGTRSSLISMPDHVDAEAVDAAVAARSAARRTSPRRTCGVAPVQIWLLARNECSSTGRSRRPIPGRCRRSR